MIGKYFLPFWGFLHSSWYYLKQKSFHFDELQRLYRFLLLFVLLCLESSSTSTALQRVSGPSALRTLRIRTRARPGTALSRHTGCPGPPTDRAQVPGPCLCAGPRSSQARTDSRPTGPFLVGARSQVLKPPGRLRPHPRSPPPAGAPHAARHLPLLLSVPLVPRHLRGPRFSYEHINKI